MNVITTRASRLRSVVRPLRGNKALVIAIVALSLLVLSAVFAPLLAPYDPNGLVARPLLGPSGKHWLGTDDLGRDTLSRILFGTRLSLGASAVSVGVAILIGVPIGFVAGYLGGKVDAVIMRLIDVTIAFPALIFAMVVISILGPGMVNAMAAIGLVIAPSLTRLVRAEVLSLKERSYVEAARGFRCSGWSISRRHLLPNAVQPLLVQVSLLLALALLAEAGLSFLGLGAQPPSASWGSMLSRANRFLESDPFVMVPPGAAIVLTGLVFFTLGEGLRHVFSLANRHSADVSSDATADLLRTTPIVTSPV